MIEKKAMKDRYGKIYNINIQKSFEPFTKTINLQKVNKQNNKECFLDYCFSYRY